MINFLKTLFNKMVIKFHKGATHGTTANTGSCRTAVKYIDHEDEERLKQGKEPYKYMTASGEQLSSEEAIRYIDERTKGLCKKDYKFYLAEVCPSKEEIRQMGQDEREIYDKAISYMEMILNEYAINFNREGLKDRSNLVVVWKPHYTRGKNGEEQFHIHIILGHKTQGIPGKELKISPISNHRNTDLGPIKGGFDRKSFIVKSEKLFDILTGYERKVAETFEYVSTMKRGSVEQKAEQAEKLVNENAQKLEADIRAGIERRRKNLANKHDIEEIAAMLDGKIAVPEQSSAKSTMDEAVVLAEMRNTLLSTFANAKDKNHLALKLVAEGFTFYFIKAKDVPGIEDVRFIKRGKTYLAHDIMTTDELHTLLSHVHRIGGLKPAFKIREELSQKPSQKKHGGPKLGR